MNTFQIRGWVDQVVEIAFEGSESSVAFQRQMSSGDNVQMSMFAKVIPTSTGSTPLGAMVEGQIENVVYVRVQCPAYLAASTFEQLTEAARRASPETPR